MTDARTLELIRRIREQIAFPLMLCVHEQARKAVKKRTCTLSARQRAHWSRGPRREEILAQQWRQSRQTRLERAA